MAYALLNTFSVLLFVGAAFSFGLALYAATFRSSDASRGLVGILLGAGLWSVADGLRIAAPTAAEVLFWNKVTYVGAGVVAPATLAFVAAYTDRERWLRPRRFGPVVAVSVLMVLVVFTNQWHGLWRPDEVITPGTDLPVLSEELGIAHVTWIAWVLLGVVPLLYVLLIREFLASDSRLFRRQIGIVLLGVTGPVVGSALYVVGLTPVDLTPFGFAVFGVAVTFAITRYRVLDIVPIARDTVVETIDNGVLVLDSEDRIVDANPRAIEIIDADRDDLVGQRATEYFAEYDAVLEAIRTLEDGRTTVSIDTGSETRHYRASFSSIRDGSGHALGRVVIFGDITDQVERRERLVEQTEQLERRNEQLDRFASVVSHDLRNPLNVVKLRLEQARDTDEEEPLDAALEAVERMERMTDRLLTLARTGQTLDDTEVVHLTPVVDRAWESVATDGSTLVAEENLGSVEGDPDLVLELFENLYRNAVEHNESGVTVTVGRLDDDDRVGFFVEDDGVGIDRAQRERVFDHGFTTDSQGTGVGLSVAENIAEAHGWGIDVAESDDGGARFEILTSGR